MYKANFLWPYVEGSVEEAGYEFANARTEEYRQQWWNVLLERVAQHSVQRAACPNCGSSEYHIDVGDIICLGCGAHRR